MELVQKRRNGDGRRVVEPAGVMDSDGVVTSGLHELGHGKVVSVRGTRTGDLVDVLGRDLRGDSRVLHIVRYDALGARHESFSSAVARKREELLQDSRTAMNEA